MAGIIISYHDINIKTGAKAITLREYRTLAAFRRSVRQFLAFSAEAAAAVGLAPEQHQALLAIKAFPGRAGPAVGELAERLGRRHHSTVGLVDRLARHRLVHRTVDARDRRRIRLRLTGAGEALLARLSRTHRDELRRLRPELRRLLGQL